MSQTIGIPLAIVEADRRESLIRAAEANGRIAPVLMKQPVAAGAHPAIHSPLDVRALAFVFAWLTWPSLPVSIVGTIWICLWFGPVEWLATNLLYVWFKAACFWVNKHYPKVREFVATHAGGHCTHQTLERRVKTCQTCPYNAIYVDGARHCMGKEDGAGCGCPREVGFDYPGGRWSVSWYFARIFNPDGSPGWLLTLVNYGCPQGRFAKGEQCSIGD